MANTVDATDESFDALLDSDKPVVVNFWATWCGPCRAFAPIVDEVAGEHADRITVAKVEIDGNASTAARYRIMGVPTTIVFQGGEPVKQIVGGRSKPALLGELSEYLG